MNDTFRGIPSSTVISEVALVPLPIPDLYMISYIKESPAWQNLGFSKLHVCRFGECEIGFNYGFIGSLAMSPLQFKPPRNKLSM